MAKRVITAEAFMKTTEEAFKHYSEGLLHRGEFCLTVQQNLDSLGQWDLSGAKRTIEAYGYTIEDFAEVAKKL